MGSVGCGVRRWTKSECNSPNFWSEKVVHARRIGLLSFLVPRRLTPSPRECSTLARCCCCEQLLQRVIIEKQSECAEHTQPDKAMRKTAEQLDETP